MTVLFWCSAAVLFHVFAGYPLLLLVWATLRSRPVRSAPWEPRISVLMIVRNEQAAIGGKLLNLLAMDYPREKCEIMVVSDASSDGTDAIVEEFAPQGVSLRRSPLQRGKPANLNEYLPQLHGEIVILMDARQSLSPGFARALLANFSDPQVGAVSGELLLEPGNAVTADAAASGVGFYWRYEKALRRLESRIDSSVGATGALYAIRRSLYLPIAADSLLDDLLIPMNIVRQGYRVSFEPRAMARDAAPVSARSEFRRKVRTIAGNFQLFTREPWLLNPFANRLWLQTLSHKFLRLTAPVFLLLLLLSNLLLLAHPFFVAVLLLQLLFYGAALAALLADARWRAVRALAIPYAFCVLNWATVIGFTRFIFRQQNVMWKP